VVAGERRRHPPVVGQPQVRREVVEHEAAQAGDEPLARGILRGQFGLHFVLEF
jgi:hypothetical protein